MTFKATIGIVLSLLLIGILTLAFNIQPIRAVGTVSGKVTESNGVTPIVGVLVEALQQGDLVVASTTSDFNGDYSLSLTEGPYKVCASGVGYITAIEEVVNVITGTTTVDFNLTRGQMVVFDEFIGPTLDTSKWDGMLGGWGGFIIATWEPTNFSFVGLSSLSGGGAIRSKANATLDSTIIFEGRVSAYCEGHWYPGVYPDYQPRGLRVGTDPNNAIEFISYARDTVEARTVSSGVATVSQYLLPSGKTVSHWNLYRIEANSLMAKFYVNDILIATHTTNIPTGQLNVYMDTYYGGGGNIPVSADYLYMARVLQPSPPAGVGGVWGPVDKLSLLAPYIALASTILAATAATVIYARRRKKKQT